MHNNIKFFFVLSCIFLLTGCVKQFNKIAYSSTEESQVTSYKLVSEEDKARLVDLPLPINKQIWIHKDLKDPRKQIVKYFDSRKLNDLVNFYRVEMDYLGWQEISIFNDTYACLNFQKPGKVCNIIINPDNKNLVLIFIGPKKS